jgi:hypothetical protein
LVPLDGSPNHGNIHIILQATPPQCVTILICCPPQPLKLLREVAEKSTSEAVKTRFGRNSEFFSQKKWGLAQNYDLHSSYLLENIINTCKASFFLRCWVIITLTANPYLIYALLTSLMSITYVSKVLIYHIFKLF